MEKIKKEHPEAKTKEVVISDEDEPVNRVLETTADVFNGFSPNSGEEVLIVFAIVGVVLVVAWIASFPVAVYKALNDKNANQRHMISLNYFNFSMDESHGDLLGLKYGFYLGQYVGITSEIGQYTLKDRGPVDGQYWSIGPSILMNFTKELMLKLDLGAGSSFNSYFGLMSKAELTLNWIDKSGFTLGVGLGGMYLKVKEFEDVTRANQEIGFGYSANMGYLF